MSKEQLEGELYREFKGLLQKEILIVTEAPQLNLLGQTFRPVFTGTISKVEPGHLTLSPVTIKMINAPFYKFPTALSIPFEKISAFTAEWDGDTIFSIS